MLNVPVNPHQFLTMTLIIMIRDFRVSDNFLQLYSYRIAIYVMTFPPGSVGLFSKVRWIEFCMTLKYMAGGGLYSPVICAKLSHVWHFNSFD